MDIDVVIIEAIEVIVNYILYLRDIYPAQIFKKVRLYNTPIYVSKFEPLNDYLRNILRTCRELLKQKSLHSLEVRFYNDEENTGYESYMIEVKSLTEDFTDNDVLLKHFEEDIKVSLMKITQKINKLKKLPTNTKFKTLIQTTDSAFTKISHNPHFEHFPWHLQKRDIKGEAKKVDLMPLISAKSLGLRIWLDVFS